MPSAKTETLLQNRLNYYRMKSNRQLVKEIIEQNEKLSNLQVEKKRMPKLLGTERWKGELGGGASTELNVTNKYIDKIPKRK